LEGNHPGLMTTAVLQGEKAYAVFPLHLAIFSIAYGVQGLTGFGGGMFSHAITLIAALVAGWATASSKFVDLSCNAKKK
jgi:hypothetical protein